MWIIEIIEIIVGILAVIVPATIWFTKKFKIVKRTKYNNLLKANKSLSEENSAFKEQLRKYESGEDLFKDLQYDPNDNVWLKETVNGVIEYYCPVCKTERVRMPLDKHKDTVGNLFYCRRCNKPFGSGHFRPIDTEIRGFFD